jgi:integrase
MARGVDEYRIQGRTARGRLEMRHKPYWRAMSEGSHLGYRRGKTTGSWFARYMNPKTSAYVTKAIGEADDRLDADGQTILSYKQAMDQALHWIELDLSGGALPANDPDLTVGEAVGTYIAWRDARRSSQAGREVKSDAHYKLTAHVLEDRKLPQVRLAALTEADLTAWQVRLVRKKPSSMQRIINDLKAALNAAFIANRRVLPPDLPVTIKYGLSLGATEMLISNARENQILSDDQVRGVVAAAIAIDEDFGRLVVLLAATGARFSQIARMSVADVQAEQMRLMIPQSFKGRKRVLQYVRVSVGADMLAAIAPVTAGRPASAPLLEHWRMKQVTAVEWVRDYRGAWATPSEMLRMWQRAVADAGLPASTVPYALRHSSIVRGLRAGLPIRLVAALHDTSVGMIERHYSRWITDGLEELVARAVVPIVAMAAAVRTRASLSNVRKICSTVNDRI